MWICIAYHFDEKISITPHVAALQNDLIPPYSRLTPSNVLLCLHFPLFSNAPRFGEFVSFCWRWLPKDSCNWYTPVHIANMDGMGRLEHASQSQPSTVSAENIPINQSTDRTSLLWMAREFDAIWLAVAFPIPHAALPRDMTVLFSLLLLLLYPVLSGF